MDSDLQDPPEMLEQFVDRWQKGYEVVYAIRRKRKENIFKRSAYSIFYHSIKIISDIDVPLNAGDFCLLDRQVVDLLVSLRERNRFLRGMTVWVGFTQAAVPYERDARHAGETKYPLRKMLRFSFDAITSFSSVPLQLATILGLVISAVAFFIGIPLTVVARYTNIFDPGVPSIMVLVLLLGGIQLMTLGVIGEYIGRIYDEVKNRPLYVVRDRVNAEPPERS